MALSNPRAIFGVHNFTPYSRTTGLPYGTVKVLDSSTFSTAAELVKLNGGSNRYPWAVEDGANTAELSLKFSQYEDFLFELFMGNAPTATGVDSDGSVVAIANVKGTSAVAATGIASATLKSGQSASVKFAKYVVKAVSSTTVDVYVKSDVDAARGTDFTIQDDLMKITASALTIATTTAVEIPGTGIELTGGAGTIALVTGDTAEFSTQPIRTKMSTVRIGGASFQTKPEFGAIIVAQKRGSDELTEMDLFRCKAAGMPIGFDTFAWSKAEVKAEVFFDSVKDGIFDFTHVTI